MAKLRRKAVKLAAIETARLAGKCHVPIASMASGMWPLQKKLAELEAALTLTAIYPFLPT